MRVTNMQRDGIGNSSRCNLIEPITVVDGFHSAQCASLIGALPYAPYAGNRVRLTRVSLFGALPVHLTRVTVCALRGLTPHLQVN